MPLTNEDFDDLANDLDFLDVLDSDFDNDDGPGDPRSEHQKQSDPDGRHHQNDSQC